MKMSVNGPMKMYKVKPLYDICPLINLPTCMYKVKNLYNDSMPSEKVSEDDLNLLEIEKYQLNIIQKLEDLKDKVLKMKEDFGIQNQTVGLSHITSSCSIPRNNRKPWWNDECQMAKKKRQKRWDIFRRYPTTENYIAFKQAKSEARRVCRKCQREFWGVETFQDIVIKANPAYPPLSLWVFYKIFSKCTSVRLVSYVHSSLVKVPEFIKNFQNISSSDSCAVSLTIVWREGNKDHEMMINPINQGVVEGEVNIARYIARLLNFNYDTDPILSTQIDNWLELAHSSIIHGSNKERQSALKSLNSHLGKNNYLVGNSLSLADIVFWSSVVQAKLHENFPANVAKWYKSLSEDEMFAYCNNLL